MVIQRFNSVLLYDALTADIPDLQSIRVLVLSSVSNPRGSLLCVGYNYCYNNNKVHCEYYVKKLLLRCGGPGIGKTVSFYVLVKRSNSHAHDSSGRQQRILDDCTGDSEVSGAQYSNECAHC